MFKTLLITVLALAVVAVVVFVGGKYLSKEAADETTSMSEEKVEFRKTGRQGAHTDYTVINGIISGDWIGLAGPNIHGGSAFYFLPDASSRAKLPPNRFGTISERFRIAQNGVTVNNLFGVDLLELEASGKDCEISGGNATIRISSYHVLEAEIGGTDYADLDKVISYSPSTLRECK